MRNTRVLAGSIALTVAALALAGCAAPSADQPRSLVLAPVADVLTFAPQDAGDGHAVQWTQPVYDTLIHQLPDGSFTGMLAAEWSYDESLTELTLELQDDVTFSDGEAFDAQAVRTNLLATRDGNGPLSTQLASVQDVVVVDGDTVRLELSAPDPSLIRGLSQPSGMIAGPEAVGTEALATSPVGTGPYILDEERTVRGSEYVFVKRADYWNEQLSLPYDELIYRPMTEITARVNALQSGEVDGAYVDTRTAGQLRSAGLNVIEYPAAGVVGLFLLDRAGELQPALADVRVRQAINLALDREGMLSQLRDDLGTTTVSIFNPESAIGDARGDRYPYDVDRARALMAEAGYADGFTIEIPEIPGWSEPAIVSQALADIGITVEWAKVAPNVLLDEMRSGSYPVILMQLQSTHPWQAIQFFVAPEAPWNILGSSDPELTELIHDVQYADASSEAEAYSALDEFLVENAWFAPFYFPDNLYATGADTAVTPQFQQGVPSIYDFEPAS